MTGKMTWLPVTLLVFGSSMAVAQTPSLKQGNGDEAASDHSASRFQVFLDSSNLRQKEAQTTVYEDIEIMRRLLSSKLEKLYPLRARERRNPTLWFNRLPEGRSGEWL